PRGRRKDASLKVPHPLWFEVRVGSGEEVELADGRASESPGSRTLQRDGLGQVIRKAGLGDRNRPEERVVLDPKSAVEDHAVGKELLEEGVSTNLVELVLAEIEVVDVIARLAAVAFVVEPDGYHVSGKEPDALVKHQSTVGVVGIEPVVDGVLAEVVEKFEASFGVSEVVLERNGASSAEDVHPV